MIRALAQLQRDAE